jgi:hypothetical protein
MLIPEKIVIKGKLCNQHWSIDDDSHVSIFPVFKIVRDDNDFPRLALKLEVEYPTTDGDAVSSIFYKMFTGNSLKECIEQFKKWQCKNSDNIIDVVEIEIKGDLEI